MQPDNITLREMKPGEGKTLYALAKRSFSFFEALGASVPKQAIVAMVDGEIAGAVFLKVFAGRNGDKNGYLDLAFVSKEYRGRGIGNLMYPAAVTHLKETGCRVVGAMVKDDNIASWGLLEKNGFSMPDYAQFFQVYGAVSGLLLWLKTVYCIACGMNFWISEPIRKRTGPAEFGRFALINLLLMLGHQGLLLLRGGGEFAKLLAGGVVLAVSLLGGWIGTRIAGGKWQFHTVRGGLLITGPLMLTGTFFPVMGRWYPERSMEAAPRRRALGLAGLCEWCAVLALYVVSCIVLRSVGLVQYIRQYAMILLVFHVLSFYPFEHMGGKRVLDFSLPAFLVLCAATVGALALL